jgi:hypothetical protein
MGPTVIDCDSPWVRFVLFLLQKFLRVYIYTRTDSFFLSAVQCSSSVELWEELQSEPGRGRKRGSKSSWNGNMEESLSCMFPHQVEAWFGVSPMPSIPIVLRRSFLFLSSCGTVHLDDLNWKLEGEYGRGRKEDPRTMGMGA